MRGASFEERKVQAEMRHCGKVWTTEFVLFQSYVSQGARHAHILFLALLPLFFYSTSAQAELDADGLSLGGVVGVYPGKEPASYGLATADLELRSWLELRAEFGGGYAIEAERGFGIGRLGIGMQFDVIEWVPFIDIGAGWRTDAEVSMYGRVGLEYYHSFDGRFRLAMGQEFITSQSDFLEFGYILSI